MDLPRPGIIQFVALTLAWACTACATTVRVPFEEPKAFSHSRTWDWRHGEASTVEAAASEQRELRLHLSRLIEQALRTRGYEYSHDGADFFVTYHLEHRLRIETVEVPMAPYLLNSLTSSPSYLIEGSKLEQRAYREVRLGIEATKGDGRTIWLGILTRRQDGGAKVPLKDAVGNLLERFPQGAFLPEAGEQASSRVAE